MFLAAGAFVCLLGCVGLIGKFLNQIAQPGSVLSNYKVDGSAKV